MTRFLRTARQGAVLLGALLLTTPAVEAGDPFYVGAGADYNFASDEAMRPNNFDDWRAGWGFRPNNLPGYQELIRCTTRASIGGQGRKGVRVIMGGELIDANTEQTIMNLPSQTDRTDKAGWAVQEWPVDLDQINNDVIALLDGVVRGGKRKVFDTLDSNCTYGSYLPCAGGPETLCLDNNRFRVEADWRTQNQSGPAMVQSTGPGPNSGSFYFFNPNQQEFVIQLLDQCSDNNHFWVFASGLTNVEVNITVTDTQTGTTQAYLNPLGTPFQPIQDTAAFATCP